MRLVFDTNILISALIARNSPPAELYDEWLLGRFDLVTCERQLSEIREVSRRPSMARRFKPSEAGRVVNNLRRIALVIEPREIAPRSSDPNDDFLLGLSDAGEVDYLVTGDKSGLLALEKHGKTKILSSREMVRALRT